MSGPTARWWAAAMLGAVPESARRAGFGGVGFLVDTMRSMGTRRRV